MTEIINILVVLTFITLWIDEFVLTRHKLKINMKPFNCSTCLAFWSGVVLTFISLNIIYLTIPLILRVIEKRLL